MHGIEPNETTELLPIATPADGPRSAAAPVFVDSSGRRRRFAHRLAVGAFLAAGCYSLLVIWSRLGGPVSPDTLMPFSASGKSTPSATAHASVSGAASAATSANGLPTATASNAAGSRTAASTGASAVAPQTSASTSVSASGSVSVSATTRKPTAPPGKPSSSATGTGHGH